MNDFIQKLLDDIHNINPELALKRQTEYNQNFVNKVLNEQCDIHGVVKSFTPTQILKVLDDCSGLIDAKEYFLDENI